MITLKQSIKHQQEVFNLSLKIVERATGLRGGSCCMVPSSRPGRAAYRVDVDENYNPIKCPCDGFAGWKHCKHCNATVLYFASKLEKLLSKKNPVCVFYRSGKLVKARVSQLSKSEKQALREQLANERRAAYAAIYNPCNVA